MAATKAVALAGAAVLLLLLLASGTGQQEPQLAGGQAQREQLGGHAAAAGGAGAAAAGASGTEDESELFALGWFLRGLPKVLGTKYFGCAEGALNKCFSDPTRRCLVIALEECGIKL